MLAKREEVVRRERERERRDVLESALIAISKSNSSTAERNLTILSLGSKLSFILFVPFFLPSTTFFPFKFVFSVVTFKGSSATEEISSSKVRQTRERDFEASEGSREEEREVKMSE